MIEAIQASCVRIRHFILNKKKSLVSVNRQHLNTFVTLCLQDKEIMKVLNVAEKNDAAKNIAGHLSRGTSRRREGLSKFNKIYEFNVRLWNQNCQMIMTSVSGHLLTYEFAGNYRKWYSCPPLSLFEAPVMKLCAEENYEKIKKTIEREVKTCNALIIWTDCDREGENIGFEIIQVCQAVKPNIQVYRAKFSEITQISIERALQTLEQPNKALSDAVDVRSELDLRIGASFTRFQTMRLQKKFPTVLAEMLISYGPCQFPTLGFVVERFLAIERFQEEPYWKLKVTHTQNDLTVDFRWARNRLFEKLPCEVFLDICQENPLATVEKVTSKPKSKWRPLPLDTIELEKQGSRKLRLTAKETMRIAEKLYSQGFISYPRTETNIFPKEMDLATLVNQQTAHHTWGGFAHRVLDEGITPRQGKKSDQAHPPIHPTKFTDSLNGTEAQVYEFVVRHFLACVSKNAEGFETVVEIDIAGEKFLTNGLQIVAKNYLEVYIYETWNAKEIHIYERGQTFMPTSIDMLEEVTSPPKLLTEADLIALMDKHGIGTDATHAEHIETIKSRAYVGIVEQKYLVPGKLGIGLVMGYDRMGFQMSKPHLRAELENDLKLICEGQKQPDEVRQRMITKYRQYFVEAMAKAATIDTALAEYLNEQPAAVEEAEIAMPVEEVPILKCPKCNSNMVVKTKREGNSKYIGCTSFPTCRNVIWLPDTVEDIEVLNDRCNQCPNNILKKIKVKLRRNAFPQYGSTYESCIGGCDEMFNNLMNVRLNNVRIQRDIGDTGYDSSASFRSNVTTTTRQTPSITATPSQRPNPPRSQANDTSWSGVSTQTRPPPPSGSSSSSWIRPDDSWNDSGANSSSTAGGRGGTGRGPVATNNTSGIGAWSAENEGDIVCHCHQPAKKLTVRKEGPNQGRTFYKCVKPVGQDCNFFLWGSESDGDNTSAAEQRPATTGWSQNQNNRQNSTNNWQSNQSTSYGWQNNQTPSSSWSNNQSNSNNWQNNQNFSNNRQNNQNSFSAKNSWDGDDGGGFGGGSEVTCSCGRAAKKLTVNKEGPNKGRQFYGCPQGPNSTCNFFQWAEDTGGGSGGGGDGGGYSSGWARPSTTRGRGRGRGGGAGAMVPKRPKPLAPGTSKRKCGVCGVEGHTKRTCPQNAMD
ncbi:hypothetical protein QAD02_015073 [Eretmocerus hayati]|uniref:Uncharacterized protein n=1 Tax=Eretmocerus hayati TaxID=131215 RepID=A0ACC2P8V5_9HYME|nr:hypothetical protein QAD02_015073 [Eretmocerus hayati]